MTDEQLIERVARELREDLQSRARHVFIDGNEYVRSTHLAELLASYCHSVNWPPRFAAAISALPSTQADDEVREALRREIINSPETADFMAGVPIEAIHQRERWGSEHDAGKSPFDWFWLIGYLAQKAATSAVAGDAEKAKHHTISTAAALANWHLALNGTDGRMRPGIGPDNGGEKAGSAFDLAHRIDSAALAKVSDHHG